MKKRNNIVLLVLLIIVIFYLSFKTLTNHLDGFNISDKPCDDIPYIKYEKKYVCFDPLTKKHNTMSAFNHGQQMCEIFPNGKKLTLKDPLNDNSEYTKKTDTICNPIEVIVT